MMYRLGSWGFVILLALALLLSANVPAQAQMAKQGTYAGWFGWSSSGTLYEMGKDEVHWVGEYGGATINDAGKGLWHDAGMVCQGSQRIKNGLSTAEGTCVMTDAEGDKTWGQWSCTGKFPVCDGNYEILGGSGKYAGITGKNTFHSMALAPTKQGWSKFDGGTYRIP
jgi:hypothetical protein